MKKLVEYEIDNDDVVIIEVDVKEQAGAERVSRSEDIIKTGKKFDEIFDRMEPVVQKIINNLKKITDSPSEINIRFGVKIGIKAGLIISSAESEGNFTISLKWKR